MLGADDSAGVGKPTCSPDLVHSASVSPAVGCEVEAPLFLTKAKAVIMQPYVAETLCGGGSSAWHWLGLEETTQAILPRKDEAWRATAVSDPAHSFHFPRHHQVSPFSRCGSCDSSWMGTYGGDT